MVYNRIKNTELRTFFKVFREIVDGRFSEGQVKFERDSKIIVRGLTLVPEGNVYYQAKLLSGDDIRYEIRTTSQLVKLVNGKAVSFRDVFTESENPLRLKAEAMQLCSAMRF